MPHLPHATLAAAALFAAAPAAGQGHQHASPKSDAMIGTPSSILHEHHELHETLARATKEGGALGVAARSLDAALAPHFKREEEIATPPLGLLPALAQGLVTEDMRSVLPMTKALERELPQMLREHESIRAAVTKFRAAAQSAGRADYVRFSDQLAAHARQEEEILYPAAVVVGRYVEDHLPRR